MKAIIVGHGPSIMGEEMGHLIDEFDIVIRLKRCQHTLDLPQHFGTKTTVVAGSLTIAGALRDIEAEQYWVFVDSRHTNVDPQVLENIHKLFIDKPVVLDKPVCETWDEMYRSKRDELGAHGHNHTSQGFKAIVYALEHFDLDELILVGFDNIMTGTFTWSITRGPDWTHYPDHRWDVEHALLEDVKKIFKTKIGFLLPDTKEEQCAS